MPEEPITFGRCCFAPPKKDAAARRETELKKLKTMKTLKTGLAEDAYRLSSADTSLATPRAKAAVKYEHKVRLHKVGSELFGKYNLGIVCGEHGVGHICVQEVSGRYARELVAGSPLIRVRLFAPEERDVHPASAAQANELIATHECVELVVGVSMQMLAKQLQDVARKLEPELTRELSKLAAERGGTLKGLDHRLKTVESLLRKIAADTEEENRALLDALAVEETTDADRAALADGVDTAAIAYTVKDALRYTVVFPTKVYTESVYKLKEKLKTLGYDAYQEKNYWGVGDNYQGINDVFISPVKLGTEGDAHFKFEVQMHTPESFALKMGLGHRLYEKFRVERDPEKKLQLWEESLTAADAVPVPEGALSIPHLTSYPQPDEVRLYSELLLFRAQCIEPHVTKAMDDLFGGHQATAYVGAAPTGSGKRVDDEGFVTEEISEKRRGTALNHTQVAGLDYKLKAPRESRKKLTRAINHAQAEGSPLSAARAAERMEDVLRYTVLLPNEAYTKAVKDSLDALKKHALFTPLGVRNQWLKTRDLSTSRGIFAYFRATVKDEAGSSPEELHLAGGSARPPRTCVFEVQFHTHQSYKLKEEKVDPLIAQLKDVPTGSGRSALMKQAMAVWFDLPVPDGVETIKSKAPTVGGEKSLFGDESQAPLFKGH